MKNKYENLEIKDFDDVYDLIEVFDSIAKVLKCNESLGSVSIYGKAEFIYEVFKILVMEYGYEVGALDFARDYFDEDYNEEYCLRVFDDLLICVEKARFDEGELYNIDDVAFINQDDCKQDLIENALDNEASVTLFGFEDRECSCGGCDYCGTVGCKETPAETVKNDVLLVDNYFVNGEKVSKDEYEAKEKEFLKEYCELMDDFNNKLSTLNEVDRLIHNAFRLF